MDSTGQIHTINNKQALNVIKTGGIEEVGGQSSEDDEHSNQSFTAR